MNSRKSTPNHRVSATARQAARMAEQFRATFEQAAVGMAHVDPTGRWLRVNQKLCAIVGYRREELQELTFQEITYPPDLDNDLELLAQLVAGEIETYSLEKRYIRKDGALVWVNLTVALVRTAEGAPDFFIAVVEDLSARKHLEGVVSAAAERLTDVLDSMTDAFFTIDRDWHCTYLNPAGEHLLQQPADAVLGRDIWDIYPQFIETNIWHACQHVMAECQPATIEEYFPAIDLWVEIRMNPTADGMSVFIRDISARRRAERERADLLAREQAARHAAEAAQRRLEAVLDVLPAGVIITDAQGAIQIVNPEVRRIFAGDLPKARIVAEYAQHAGWQMDGRPLTADELGLTRALTDATERDQEVEILALDGTRRLINNNSAPLRDENGAITGAVTAFLDVTERRRMAQRERAALRALLTMAQTIALPATDDEAASHDGVQRVVELVQEVFGGVYTGYTQIDTLTNAVHPLAVAGLSEVIEARWWRNLRGAHLSDFATPDIIARLQAGETVQVDLAAQPPIPGQDYFDLHTVLIIPAVFTTETWCVLTIEAQGEAGFNAEDIELAQGAMHLMTLVVERDRLLQERERARAQTLALATTQKQMDEFLGIASHELRSPLTAVQMSVQLAAMRLNRLRPALSPESAVAVAPQLDQLATLLDRAGRQVQRMDRLVHDLLDLSRIDAGSLALRLTPYDLVQVVREAVEEQREAAPDRIITLALPPTPAPVQADADRIGQVVTNFLTNALKYAPADRPIAVAVTQVGCEARVAVTDRGPGLSSEQQARLWERFYRVPGIAQQHGSGASLGLGLYICATIIARHNGQIGVTSTVGAGSTFWFTLPCA